MRSRWTIPPAAVAIHLCVGSVYAWSVFNKPIEALHPDWPKGAAAYTFSIAIALLGLSAAFGGTYRADCVDAASLTKFVTDHYAKAPEDLCFAGQTSF